MGLESEARLPAECELPSDLMRGEFACSLLKAVPEALIVSDTKGCIVAVNQSACKIFGYEEEEMLRRDVSMLMPSPDHERHGSYIESYLRSGEKRIIGIGRYVTAVDKHGRQFPVELTVGELGSGPPRGFVAILRDLTVDEERYRVLSELRGEIAQAFRVGAVGLLSSAIAHEINQPLATIRNYVETISDLVQNDTEIDAAQLREAMVACSQETERAGEIVRRLRQFMARGETELDRHSLNKLVEDGIALALPGSQAKTVDVTLDLEPGADVVLVDGIQIQQVIFNLIRNALQAMSLTRRPSIKVSARRQDAMSEVIVEDCGSGIDEKVIEHLFLPFVSTKPEGFGVGLPICRAIIEAHGGQIWVTHSEQGGAAFHFTVPRDLEPEGPKA